MALCRKQSFSPPTELPITGSRVASKRERNLYLIFTLSHLQGDAGRALADGERATLSARAETLHRRAAVGVALRDVELRLVHPHVVLGVGRAREQRVENRFAGSVRHKLEHDQALFVALTANNIENSANLRRRHAHAAQVAHRLLLFGVNLSSSRETHRRRHSRQSLHLSHESHNFSRHHATDHRASTSSPRGARIKQNPPTPSSSGFRESTSILARPPARDLARVARPRARERLFLSHLHAPPSPPREPSAPSSRASRLAIARAPPRARARSAREIARSRRRRCARARTWTRARQTRTLSVPFVGDGASRARTSSSSSSSSSRASSSSSRCDAATDRPTDHVDRLDRVFLSNRIRVLVLLYGCMCRKVGVLFITV